MAVGVRQLLRRPFFPALYGTRLVSQTSDGVFQTALASSVFFSADHQTDPKQAAAGFVVLLLPYSLVGPFAGVFLDRWQRRQVLVRANAVRAALVVLTASLLVGHGPRGVAFYGAALAALSVNRFYLAALSASLPHVVARDELVSANALTTTSGTLAALVGGGLGLGLRAVAGAGDAGDAAVAVVAAFGYVGAAVVARRMPVALLGPDPGPDVPVGDALRAVGRGLVAGARHVAARRRSAYALAAIGAHRLLYGLSTIATLLLYRNYFHDAGLLRAGLVGLGQALAAGGVGVVAAAVVTPLATARMPKHRWITLLFAGAAVVEVALGAPYRMAPLLLAAVLLGFAAQGSKICVDTIVQEDVDDDFRGRVFSFYDTLFNLTFVVAAVVGAFTLPTSGKSYAVLGAIAAGYAAVAAAYGAATGTARADVTGRPAPAGT